MKWKVAGLLCFLIFIGFFHTAGAAPRGNGSILVSSGNRVLEYDQNGQLLRTINILYYEGGSRGGQVAASGDEDLNNSLYPGDPHPAGEVARDLVFAPNDTSSGTNFHLAVYNGTTRVFLSRLDFYNNSFDGQPRWLHSPPSSGGIPGLSTVNQASFGSIARYNIYYYLTDMATINGGEAKGIVRYYPGNNTFVRFADQFDFIDINVGLDNRLYGLDVDGATVHVYNPDTMQHLGDVALPAGLDIRAIAVNFSGNIFAAAANGMIYCFTGAGATVNSVNTGYNDLTDLDLSSDGKLIAGSVSGHVIITTESLAAISSFQASTSSVFVAFGGYTISGTVTDESGAPLSGAQVTISGSDFQMGSINSVAVTDASGRYCFGDFTGNGYFTVNVSHQFYTFNPSSVSVNSFTQPVVLNFAGTRARYTISGFIYEFESFNASGFTVTLSGDENRTVVTDSSGSFRFEDLLAGGRYTVTPSRAFYTFSPESSTFPALDHHYHFSISATRMKYAINGRVNAGDGSAIAGATVSLSGERFSTATTDANGNYSFTNLPAGFVYNVTPAKNYYDFAPASTTLTLDADKSANFLGTLRTYAISGAISSEGAPLASVTVTLSGARSATATTDANGNYSFPGLPAGESYTVTPTRAFYTFSPANATINPLASNTSVNFAGTLQRFTISGNVTDANGAALSGVTVTLSGAQSASSVTDASGNYAFANLPAGTNYSITPARTFYTFSPVATTINPLSGNSAANFVGTLQRFTISGSVTDAGGAGLSGATVTLTGAQSASVVTDASGNYVFANLPAGETYTVTAAKANTTFTPASQTFAPLDGNKAANFRVASITLSIIADAYVTDGKFSSDSFGTVANLLARLSSRGGETHESYLKLDVAGINGQIASVKLRLSGRLADTTSANIPVTAFSTSSSWSETAITWKNRPTANGSLATATITDNTMRSYEWEITGFVNSERSAGRTVMSIILRGAATTNNQAIFNSRESGSSTPQVVITFE